MKKLVLQKTALFRSLILFVCMLILFSVSAFYQIHAYLDEKNNEIIKDLSPPVDAIEANSHVALQMARVLASYASALPQTISAHEDFLVRMMEASRNTSIYGMGIWYEPGVFPGKNPLFGPYVHFDLKNREKIVLTYEWSGFAYNYPAQAWYHELMLAPEGSVVSTEPYFDTDLTYISSGGTFYRDGKKAGVVSVGFVLPTLSGLIKSFKLPQFRTLYIYTKRGFIVYEAGSDDLKEIVKSAGNADIVRATEEWYRQKGIGAIAYTLELKSLPWTVLAVVNRNDMMKEIYRDIRNEGVFILFLWTLFSAAFFLRANYLQQRILNRKLESENSLLRDEIDRRTKLEHELQSSRNELAELNGHLSFLAYHDPVTGLENTNAMLEQIARIENDDTSSSFLSLVSMENLRELSTVFDRDLIDFMLNSFSGRLSRLCPASCSLFRGFGFSFYILSSGSNEAELTDFLDKLATDFRHPMTVFNTQLRLRVIIGVSRLERDHDPSEALNRSMSALTSIDPMNPVSYVFYNQSHRDRKNHLLQIDSSMTHENFLHELYPVYQPIVDMHTERIVGFETLIRWKNPEAGVISPVEFIPLAEENGMIIEIGWFIMDKALDLLDLQVPGKDSDWYVTVNVSPLQFLEAGFVEKLEQRVDGRHIGRDRLNLEITESAISTMETSFWKTSWQLLERGFHFSIDDFGTGQSSLSRLSSFRFDILKIDRSFVAGLDNERNVTLIRSILGLAASFGCRTIAEGIETEAQKRQLMNDGCIFAQGFYYFKPLMMEEILALLS